MSQKHRERYVKDGGERVRKEKRERGGALTRRCFLGTGGVAAAGAFLPARAAAAGEPPTGGDQEVQIRRFKELGRTGFRVSDIGMGCGPLRDPAFARYAYDRGVNYFDTAEHYNQMASERALGQALQFMEREKVFITTKVHVNPGDTPETIRERFAGCLERLQTDYVDALFSHGVESIAMLRHESFAPTAVRLRDEGKVRHIGLSCHGPSGNRGDSAEDTLMAAIEDERFDMMLFVYNFMNTEVGNRLVTAATGQGMGLTAMKTAPGRLAPEPFDPEQLTEQQQGIVQRYLDRGRTREQALRVLERQYRAASELWEDTRPFAERHGLRSERDLRLKSIQWVISHPDLHTAVISFDSFELIDAAVALSGTDIATEDQAALDAYAGLAGAGYCRHGCSECAPACPHGVPVSTIMRYAYYAAGQGREKHAIEHYRSLGEQNALHCAGCDAPCTGACPHGVDVAGNLLRAHELMTVV